MRPNLRTSERTPRQPNSLEKKLIRYAIAGGAVLAAPAYADSIIGYNGPPILPATPGGQASLTVDGVTFDFNGTQQFAIGTGTTWEISNTWNSPGGGDLTSTALAYGSPVANANYIGGPSVLNQGQYAKLAKGSPGIVSNVMGPVPNGIDTYLGLKFTVSSQTHYGWVELNSELISVPGAEMPPYGLAQTEIVNYAFNSAPGADITVGAGTPEPSTLALFALGAVGLAAIRRRRAARN